MKTPVTALVVAAFVVTGLLMSGVSQAAAVDTSHVKEAEAFVKAALPADCDMNDRDDIPVNDHSPDEVSHFVYDITYRYSWDSSGDPPYRTQLYQMFCTMGAYNIRSAFLLRDPDAGTFQLIAFARPSLSYSYTDDNDTTLKAPPSVSGYAADTLLTNASYDPKTGVISSHAAWRGLDDAWSAGNWKMIDGEFVLVRYEVDPTYDLNADKPTGHDSDSYVLFGKK